MSTAQRWGTAASTCKQEGQRPLGRWYYSGGALAKPERTYAAFAYRELAEDFKDEAVELEIPGSKLLVIHINSKNLGILQSEGEL